MNHHAGLSTVPTSGEDPECDCAVTSGRRLSASHPSRRRQQSLGLIKQDCVNTLSMKTNDWGNWWKVWNALNALNVCLFHSRMSSEKMVTFERVGVNMVLFLYTPTFKLQGGSGHSKHVSGSEIFVFIIPDTYITRGSTQQDKTAHLFC